MKICIFMPTTIIIDTSSSLFKKNQLEKNENRIKQYQNGINKLVELNNDKNFDIYMADNGLDFQNKLIIDDKIKIIKNNPNNYGKFNKGAGLVEIWKNNIELIKQYDYIIHFEPRQLLIDNYFIDNFMKNPRALFTHNKNPNSPRHFNTGLFACKSKDLLTFIDVVSPSKLVKHNASIEYVLYNFFKNNNLHYDVLDKMSLIWYDTHAQKEYHW